MLKPLWVAADMLSVLSIIAKFLATIQSSSADEAALLSVYFLGIEQSHHLHAEYP